MHFEPAPEPGYSDVTFSWRETDPGQPCYAVVVRLIGVTDHAYDDGDISEFLMHKDSDDIWSLTVRLRSTLRSSYQICPVRDAAPTEHPSEERWSAILANGVLDPLNAMVQPAGTIYGNSGPASVLELPDAPPQPWYAVRPGVAAGTIARHELVAGDGEPAVVHVYVPAGYQPDGEPLPLAILFDGNWWMLLNIAATFDNLIADGATPPMIVAIIESIHGAPRWRALTHTEVFDPFVMDELLPWLEARWNVSRDPAKTVLAGQSLGGLVVSHLAHRHPDRFGWVLGVSVAAWWRGDSEGGLSGQDVVEAFDRSTPTAVRFVLDVGSQERELLDSVRHMRDVLVGRGYVVHYREYEGGHDHACWRGCLPDGLSTALGSPEASRIAAWPPA